MRIIRITAALVVASTLQAGTAYAAADWLDRLSGPGPFFSPLRLTYRFLCFSQSPTAKPDPTTGEIPTQRNALHPFDLSAGIFSTGSEDPADSDCVKDRNVAAYQTVTYQYWFSVENQLFPQDPKKDAYQVKLHQVQWAHMVRVHRTLDLGAGAGVTIFSGDAFDSFARMTLQPLAFEFSPFAAFGDGVQYRAIRITGGLTTFVGGFDQGDFCQPPRCTDRPAVFETRPELLWRVGVHVDLPGVIRAFR